MMHVFQFYKKHWRIPKKYYTTETRQAFQNWDNKIQSQIGFVYGKELLLPVDKKSIIQLNGATSVILQDVIGHNSSQSKLHIRHNAEINRFPDWYRQQQLERTDSQNPELAVFNNQKRIWDFEIFSIEKNDNNEFELYLRYKINEFQLGKPARDDHKLCILKKNEPLKISINGKSDFTMTGRKERSYAEYEYIIEYLGEIASVEFRELNKIGTEKAIPEKFGKHIDLRKILY